MWLSALEIGGALRYNRFCVRTETLSGIGRRKSYLITTFDTEKFNRSDSIRTSTLICDLQDLQLCQLKLTCAFKTVLILVGMCDKIIWCENFHCLALTFPARVWNHWVVGIIARKRHRFSVELSRAGFCIMTSVSAPLHLTVLGSFGGDAHLLFLRTTLRIKQSVPDGTQAKAFSIHGLRQCKKPAWPWYSRENPTTKMGVTK